MSTDAKNPSLVEALFGVDQVTEQIPAWELWEDGIEPPEEEQPRAEDRAA